MIALRLLFPQAQTKEILSELEGSGREEIGSFESLGITPPGAYPRYDMRSLRAKDIAENVFELPQDFRIFLYKCNTNDIKNQPFHRILSFTAVSVKRSEVVYFVENE